MALSKPGSRVNSFWFSNLHAKAPYLNPWSAPLHRPDMFDTLIAIGDRGYAQQELLLLALRTLGEDIMEFNDRLD